MSGLGELPKVDILYGYVEPNTKVLVDALVATGTRGIVFAGTGAGAISTSDRASLKALFSGPGMRPVMVRSSRVPNGRVIEMTANKEEYDALGVIAADTLNPRRLAFC